MEDYFVEEYIHKSSDTKKHVTKKLRKRNIKIVDDENVIFAKLRQIISSKYKFTFAKLILRNWHGWGGVYKATLGRYVISNLELITLSG